MVVAIFHRRADPLELRVEVHLLGFQHLRGQKAAVAFVAQRIDQPRHRAVYEHLRIDVAVGHVPVFDHMPRLVEQRKAVFVAGARRSPRRVDLQQKLPVEHNPTEYSQQQHKQGEAQRAEAASQIHTHS
jgi:hypothetical protein